MANSYIIDRCFEFVGSMASKRLKNQLEAVRRSPIYDNEYYSNHTKLPAHRSNAWHYLQRGWRNGLSPSKYFDTLFYLSQNPDVRRAGVNPLVHYLDHGWKEGRRPSPSFDPAQYRLEYLPRGSTEEPLSHAIVHRPEWLSSLAPVAWRPYVAASAEDMAIASASGLFDETYYRTMYPDVEFSNADLLKHYLEDGWREDRSPGPEFDTNFYLRSYPESAVDGCPLTYYLRVGRKKGHPTRFPDAITLPVDATTTADFSNLRVAVHVHAFFVDVFEEIVGGLKHLPMPFHLFVTVTTKADKEFIENIIRRTQCGATSEVVVVPNRGRDIAPLFVSARHLWGEYDLICHLHTKKSLHTDFGDDWRHYLFDQLLGSPEIVSNIIATFVSDPSVGAMFPDNFYSIKKFVDWGSNIGKVKSVLADAGVNISKLPSPAKFAAGSMAWYRTVALRGVTQLALEFDMFDDERLQLDATLAHALERALSPAVEAAGYRSIPYYPKRRVKLEYGPMRHGPVPSNDRAGWRWYRDTPKIASNRPIPLQPLSSVFDGKCLDIHWIIPDFGRGSGGHMTIFRIVELLSKFGHRQTIWIQNAFASPSPEVAKKRIQDWYRPIGDDVIVRFLPDDTRQLSGDVIVATDCWTVYPAVSCANFKARFYFIQDFEPYFHPMGENYLVAEATYRMGLSALCAGDWLLGKAKSYGMWVRKWNLASDPEFYFPGRPRLLAPAQDRPIHIAFYARSNTPRRAVHMGLAALEELAKRGVKFKALLYGEEDPQITADFDFELLGICTPEQLGELYRTADIGLVFSTTNYSLVPLEMMSCELPVVEVDTESTRCIFRNGEVAFASPDPQSVADTIETLIQDHESRARQVLAANEFVQKCDWSDSAKAVEAALFERLGELGFKAIDPEQICAPALTKPSRASVVIPVLNGGPLFEKVLDRLSRQTCEWPYDILIIDNGSDDGTQDMVRRFQSRNVRLHEIPHSQFQHGRTRNLGIELTEGDFVALTTADAMPADEHWLQNLVGGFARSKRVAGVMGRHRAYPEHGTFLARDIDEMFDRYADYPKVYSMKDGVPSHIYRGGVVWRMMMHFYSDNNSAISRAAWKHLPYPNIDWGEDQVWAWEMLKAGFEKVYVDNATVYHSHDFPLSKTYQFAFTEGQFFRTTFGYDLSGGASVEDMARGLNRRDADYALRMGVSHKDLEVQKEKTQMIVQGRADGAKAGF